MIKLIQNLNSQLGQATDNIQKFMTNIFIEPFRQ